jgi:hypothetical protein
MDLPEGLGWYGIAAVFAAYAGNSLAYFNAQNPLYPALNFTGALALIVDTRAKKDWPLFALNLVWAAIAAYSLARIYF